jgi:hypothetical protein
VTAADIRANRLDIGAKYPSRLIVRMADVVPGLMLLCAKITLEGHGNSPSDCVGS